MTEEFGAVLFVAAVALVSYVAHTVSERWRKASRVIKETPEFIDRMRRDRELDDLTMRAIRRRAVADVQRRWDKLDRRAGR